MCRLLCVLTVVCGGVLMGVSPALAAFPGENGKLAFDSDRDRGDFDVWTMSRNGSNVVNLTAGFRGDDGRPNRRAGTDIVTVAAADGTHGNGRAVVVPAGPEVTSQWFKTFFELPAAENPLAGNGDPCVRFGRNGKLLSAIAADGTVTCTAERGTVLNTGTDHFCSTFDAPPTYAVGRAEQRRCARAASQSVTTLTLTVDGRTIDILKPRFATFSPQTVVNLPVGNIFGAEPGRHTLTSYGWEVNVRNLRVGRHVITINVVDGDFSGSFEHIINIVPRG